MQPEMNQLQNEFTANDELPSNKTKDEAYQPTPETLQFNKSSVDHYACLTD